MSEPTWQPEPDNAFLPVALGTACWLVVGAVLLVIRDQPIMQGRSWWLGVCAVGAISGAGGIVYLRFRRARDARRAARVRPQSDPSPHSTHPAPPD